MLITLYFSVVEREVCIQNENYIPASFLHSAYSQAYGDRDNNSYTLRAQMRGTTPRFDELCFIQQRGAAPTSTRCLITLISLQFMLRQYSSPTALGSVNRPWV